jgi:hypothetical protein
MHRKIYLGLAVLVALAAAPAAAQTAPPCSVVPTGTTPLALLSAVDCARGGETALIARLRAAVTPAPAPVVVPPAPKPTPAPAPAPPAPPAQPPAAPAPVAAWTRCAGENETCTHAGPMVVRFGAGTAYAYQAATSAVLCSNGQFGDPAPGVVKACDYSLTEKIPAGAAPPPSGPVPTPIAFKVGPTTIGMNVSGSVYYNGERTFANLAMAASTWDSVGADGVQASGYPITSGTIQLNVPNAVWAGTDTRITCTWAGSGSFFIDGDRTGDAYADHSVSTTWRGWNKTGRPQMYLQLTRGTAADPVRNLDCREPGVVSNGVFDQRIVDDLKPYAVLRFLDMGSANGNGPVTWATRTLPTSLTQSGADGIALENMIDLANAAGSDAWIPVSWNIDEGYARQMAQLVHDRLAKGHRAYFELSNETWNYAFGQAAQALNEGVAENLSSDRYTNGLLRYAERSTWFFKIVTDVFKDDPTRLVRIVNTESDNQWQSEQVLGFKDTAIWVDALATAPYFGLDLFYGATSPGTTDLTANFAALDGMRKHAIDLAVLNKAVAAKYGKRYITYEGGQHILQSPDVAASSPLQGTIAAMERDPRMHDEYSAYIADWKARVGDELTLYSHTGSISQFGAWGAREYGAQPLADSPKRRAILEAIATP